MILLSGFYNEEYLLPWWLEHHKKIFKYGVLVNVHSTDKSVEIVKKICPHWRVVNTKMKIGHEAGDTTDLDKLELQIKGFKIYMTTTEFLVSKDSLQVEDIDLPEKPTCYSIPMFRLVDIEPENKPTYDKPLVEQKNVGYWMRGKNKNRHLHNYQQPVYLGRGKHLMKHPTTQHPTLRILKYVFSPWTEEFINRKLHMADVWNPESKFGRHHFWSRDKLENKYQESLLKHGVKHFNTSQK